MVDGGGATLCQAYCHQVAIGGVDVVVATCDAILCVSFVGVGVDGCVSCSAIGVNGFTSLALRIILYVERCFALCNFAYFIESIIFHFECRLPYHLINISYLRHCMWARGVVGVCAYARFALYVAIYKFQFYVSNNKYPILHTEQTMEKIKNRKQIIIHTKR